MRAGLRRVTTRGACRSMCATGAVPLFAQYARRPLRSTSNRGSPTPEPSHGLERAQERCENEFFLRREIESEGRLVVVDDGGDVLCDAVFNSGDANTQAQTSGRSRWGWLLRHVFTSAFGASARRSSPNVGLRADVETCSLCGRPVFSCRFCQATAA